MSEDRFPHISRRAILGSVAGAGMLGSGIGSTAGLFQARVRNNGMSVSVGSLGLSACWTDSYDCDEALFLSVGPEETSGSKTIEYELPADTNPAYVWVRTPCPEGVCGLYEKLDVTITDGPCDGDSRDIVEEGSLCDVLSAFHSGVRLGGGEDDAVEPEETRCLTITWELTEPLVSDQVIDGITFTFFATQARHEDDVDSTNPWADAVCEVDCDATEECEAGPDISWVGFCAEEGEVFTEDEFDFTVSGDTLHLDGAPEALETVLLKYGSNLEVFEDPSVPGTFRIGDGVKYGQYGNEFPGTDPTRTNRDPCPGTCGVKYEIDEDEFSSKGCEE